MDSSQSRVCGRTELKDLGQWVIEQSESGPLGVDVNIKKKKLGSYMNAQT